MKKLLLIAATSTAILASATSFADESLYIKGEAGALFMQKSKVKVPGINNNVKFKSKTTGTFALGAGCNVTDNTRVDLTLGFLANPQFKKSFAGQSTNAKVKGKVMHLMVNGYVDLFDLGAGKVFAGAGVGWAQVKEKINISVAGINTNLDKSKKANNFAYQVTVGASTQLTEGVIAELSYRWQDFGKAKYKSVGTKGTEKGKMRYRGHNVLAGVRFDI
ncbi:MAG: outer membrane beta-barrel protein [Rickettsia endosymbiont of Bryobia graminum]|nr:outer membrane beta-barrel protein [Rickettsia endosymbiont of Bryobia graminum]